MGVSENGRAHVRDLTHSINVKGVWWGCKHAIQSMKKHGKGGSIINTASMVAKVGSAAPQLACRHPLMCLTIRYGLKGGCVGDVKGTGNRECQRWYQSQRAMSGTFEHTSSAELLGFA